MATKSIQLIDRIHSLNSVSKNKNWSIASRRIIETLILKYLLNERLRVLDTYIQKAKKIYTDSRGRRNLSALNTELHDVQRIMVQNIDDVLQRGVVMDGKLLTPCWR